jgi:hypothetical protein
MQVKLGTSNLNGLGKIEYSATIVDAMKQERTLVAALRTCKIIRG